MLPLLLAVLFPVFTSTQASHASFRCGSTRADLPLRPAPPNATLALVLQPSATLSHHKPELKSALEALLAQLRPGDRLLFTLPGQPPAETNPEALLAAVDHLPARQSAPLFPAIEQTATLLAAAPAEPHLLLVLVAADELQLPALALPPGVPVFPVSLIPRHEGDSIPTYFALDRLASSSGGRLLEPFSFRRLPNSLAHFDFHPRYLLDLPPACTPSHLRLHPEPPVG